MARLVSVNVGLPSDVQWRGETVRTAIWKQAVTGRRHVGRLNIAGDGQGDLAGHGGENRAVMVYQMDSYHHWEQHLGRADFTYGQFGENFTVEGLPDDEVCIGDRYRIGGALFEVTQPRVTCYRVGIRMREPAMAALLVSHQRPGFYLRVLEEGEIGGGDEILKVADGPERLTVAAINALLYLPGHSREQLQRSLRIPALSPGWKQSLQALLDQGQAGRGNAGLSSSAEPAPAWSGFRNLRVVQVDRESATVLSLSLAGLDGLPLPAAQAGQFLVLRFHVDSKGPPVVRNYSISSPPGDKVYRVSIKQEVNGIASTFVHNHVKLDDLLEASAPRGTFVLKSGDAPVVLLSTGIGATPVLAMLHALASSQATASRDVWWLYGARNRSEHPFARESRALVQAIPRGRSHVVYSQPAPDNQLGQDYDSPGHLNVALLDQLGVPSSADYYLCGPPSFLEAFTAGLRERGTSAEQIHSEIFGQGKAFTPGIAAVSQARPHAPLGPPGTGPQVSFTRSAVSVAWSTSYNSLLELAEACSVPVKWSCRTGVCHTCETDLIGGTIEYQPSPLDPPADGRILMCCARPKEDLEVDL